MAEIPGTTVVTAEVPEQTIDVHQQPSAAPNTTLQQDLATEGQRKINLIWETTQMRVALSVIWASLIVASSLAIFGKWLGSVDLQLAAVVFVFGVANLVTGFTSDGLIIPDLEGLERETKRDDCRR